MAILLQVRDTREEAWEFLDVLGAACDEVTLEPPLQQRQQFKKFQVKNDLDANRVVIFAQSAHRRRLKLQELSTGNSWTTKIFNHRLEHGYSFVKVTNLSVTHLEGVECPLCRQLIPPFQLLSHLDDHNLAELVQWQCGFEGGFTALWEAAFIDLSEYLETIEDGLIKLGLIQAAHRMEKHVAWAEGYDRSLAQ